MAPASKIKQKNKITKSKPSKFQSKIELKKDAKQFKPKPVKAESKTPRERRLAAKKLSEERKKKRKPNYNLEKGGTISALKLPTTTYLYIWNALRTKPKKSDDLFEKEGCYLLVI